MIIGIFLLVIIVVIVLFGEIRYQLMKKGESVGEKINISENCADSTDIDMNGLMIEQTHDDFVQLQTLGMRGSWRLAQNQVMGVNLFEELYAEEFSKSL